VAIKLSSIKADIVKEMEGEWIDIPDIPGIAFLLRSSHYPPFVTAKAQAIRKLMAANGGTEIIPEKDLSRANASLFVEHLLLDWRGFAEDDDTAIEYTAERALQILSDPGFRELNRHIGWAADQVGKAQVEFVEAAAKNSDAPSAGS
jgi:hypothetical protein